MVYEKTKAGNVPFLIEDSLAFFSVKNSNGTFSQIITTEEDYRLNEGEHADTMIRLGYTLREPKRSKKKVGSK